MSELEKKVERLEYTLRTLITWMSLHLGEHGTKQLLDLLEDPTHD